jgi:hypothetical protein
MSDNIIRLSIEPTGGKCFQHGFHLGTDIRLARQIAEERFHARNANGEPTCTVALIRNRCIVGVYDGCWDKELPE